MKTLKFKTNINCRSCKTSVTPFLSRNTKITKWDVDIDHPKKILTVEGENIVKSEIVELITAAGYNITTIVSENK